jgi:hypothetical protein
MLTLESGSILSDESVKAHHLETFIAVRPLLIENIDQFMIKSAEESLLYDPNANLELMNVTPMSIETPSIVAPSVAAPVSVGPILSAVSLNESVFIFDWGQIPTTLKRQMEQGCLIGRDFRNFCNLVVDQATAVSPDCGRAFLRTVAAQIVNKYPNLFLEKDPAGNLISTSPVKFLTTIFNRRKYTRPKSIDPPRKGKKPPKSLQDSVVNFKPTIDPIDELGLIEKQEKLKNMEVIGDDARAYMRDTFPLQRFQITLETWENIKVEWPLLFQRPYIYDHFLLLTERNLEDISHKFGDYQSKVVEMIQQTKSKHSNIQTFLETIHDGYHESFVGLLTTFFKEKQEYLLCQFELGTTTSEMLERYIPEHYVKNNKKNKTLGPVICIIGKFFL